MQITEKQAMYIASIIEKGTHDYRFMQEIWDATPKNNEKYPDERADYRRLILADRLSPLTSYEASTIIDAYTKWQGEGKIKEARAYLSKCNLVKK